MSATEDIGNLIHQLSEEEFKRGVKIGITELENVLLWTTKQPTPKYLLELQKWIIKRIDFLKERHNIEYLINDNNKLTKDEDR